MEKFVSEAKFSELSEFELARAKKEAKRIFHKCIEVVGYSYSVYGIMHCRFYPEDEYRSSEDLLLRIRGFAGISQSRTD